MHNLKTVFQFEVTRTLKKKSFWLLALMFPVMMAVIFTIIIFANKATNTALEKSQSSQFSTLVFDESGLVDEQLLSAIKANKIAEKQAGITMVQKGEYEAFFYFPKDVSTQKVEVYAKNSGVFENSKYSAVAKMLLKQSIAQRYDKSQLAIMQDKVGFETQTFQDGKAYDAIKQMIAPGIFLLLFYMLIAMFGNQMLTSTTEEKENRVIEMILTTIESRTLIIGKILSLIVLAIIQSLAIVLPVIIAYVGLRGRLALPSFNLSGIPVDPLRVGVGLLIFTLSFLLFTGLLVAIGSAAPTAKEAGGFFGVIMMLLFGPLYAAPLFVSSPNEILVKVLSYFPLTAPIPLMLRNAVGNLTTVDVIISCVLLAVTAAIVLSIAVRIFRYGALEYSRRLTLKEIISRR